MTSNLFQNMNLPSSKDDNNSSNNSYPSYLHTCNAFSQPTSRQAKHNKTEHLSAEVIVQIEDRHGELRPIRALLDTGTSSTIVLRNYVRKGRAKGYKGKKIMIKLKNQDYIHVDGEGYLSDTELNFEINPLSLNVIVPSANPNNWVL